jgi:hypothetical protein
MRLFPEQIPTGLSRQTRRRYEFLYSFDQVNREFRVNDGGASVRYTMPRKNRRRVARNRLKIQRRAA